MSGDHVFEARISMPDGVVIETTVSVPESLTEGPVLLIRDVGELSEHVQMCASRLRAAVLALSEEVPF